MTNRNLNSATKPNKEPKLSRTHAPPDLSPLDWQRGLRRQFGREQAFRLENLDSGAVRWTHGLERQPSSLQASPGMTITIFSINCDTMKRARAGLGSHGAARNFHDHKTAGIARQVRFRLADASA